MGNLGSVLDEAFVADPRELPGPALIEEIVELRRQANRVDGLYMKQLVIADRSGAVHADFNSTQAWVRTALNVTPGRAARDVRLARDLADHLQLTMSALCDGSISLDHASVIARLRHRIPAEAMAAAQPFLVEAATWKDPADLRKVCDDLVHRLAPDKATRDEKDDYQSRRLHASTTIGGMGVGDFLLHPAGMELFMTAMNACMTYENGELRTAEQRRADALLTMAELALRGGTLPETGGIKPHVTVIADLGTITGADGSPAADYGFGTKSSGEWARRFSCDASVARVVFGPDGAILDAGRSTRVFTAAQRRAVISRDRTCVWSGCDAPASWCDVHHCHHWGHGGETSDCNGALVCGRHHDRIHAHGHAIIKTKARPYKVDPRPGSDPNWQGHTTKRRRR